jgi:hypothetical protein
MDTWSRIMLRFVVNFRVRWMAFPLVNCAPIQIRTLTRQGPHKISSAREGRDASPKNQPGPKGRHPPLPPKKSRSRSA